MKKTFILSIVISSMTLASFTDTKPKQMRKFPPHDDIEKK